MKIPETMTRENLIAYAYDMKRMVAGLQKQLAAALDEVARLHKEITDIKKP
jgi:hypothetical protein